MSFDNQGFLTTNDDVIPANLGLEDQRFAFEWVQENIELFGGNKSRVTIAGQSAGSASVGLHLMGPWKDGKGKLLVSFQIHIQFLLSCYIFGCSVDYNLGTNSKFNNDEP